MGPGTRGFLRAQEDWGAHGWPRCIACSAQDCAESANGECQPLKCNCGSTERLCPKITVFPSSGLGCCVACGYQERPASAQSAETAGSPRPSVFLSSSSYPVLSISQVSGLSAAPSPLVAFKAKRTLCVMDLSASQGGGSEHSSDQYFCNLCNRATNLCDRTASFPALKSGKRWPR